MMKKPWRKILVRKQRSIRPRKSPLLMLLESIKTGYDIRAYIEKKQKPKSLTRRRSGFLRRLYRARRDR